MPRAMKSTESPSRVPASFTFPADHHLLITTSGGIFSWDASGVRRLFNSSKKGILAAREATDGSQLLAVADKHTVVLHDCKRNREESWGLEGNEGQVRLLEYAPDARSLFLSTSLTGDIQCYSINEARLVDPASNHPSPPTVLAVSPSSHLMLSASEYPPVIYLQNLTLKTPPMQMHPAASDKAVVAAAFHPERPNAFMLAFKDGTLAAYDATKMARRRGVRIDAAAALSVESCAGEIAHFSKLHRIANIRQMTNLQYESQTTAIGSKSVAITAAAFLPGYRTRAVSVGADGRCRIVDFESGGRILRTWHAQAPVTSLSVLAIQETSVLTSGTKKKSALKTKTVAVGSPNSTNSIVAVGRVDGQVLLFDSLGLKLDDLVVNELGDRIISIEWMEGQSPNAMSTGAAPSSARKDTSGLESPMEPWTGREGTFDLPQALQRPSNAVFPKPSQPGVAFEVDMEVSADFATVRHTPVAARGSPAPPAACSTYLDLFSPVKQTAAPPARPTRRSPDPSPRSPGRPRISSQTFAGNTSPEATPTARKPVQQVPATPRQMHARPPGVIISSGKKSASPSQSTASVSVQRRSPLGSSSKKYRKRVVVKTNPNTGCDLKDVPATVRRNGQVLADLRKLGAGQVSRDEKKSSNLALFAPYMNLTGIAKLPRTEPPKQLKPAATSEQDPEKHPLARPERTKVHFDTESHSSDRDIWLTAGSSDNEDVVRQRRKPPRDRKRHQKSKPEQKSPRSKPLPEAQPKHTAQFSPDITEVTVISPRPHAGGKRAEVLSMSDETMHSAASHLSPLDGGFVPSSADVRKLFPRTQSLSPTSSPKRSPKRSSPQRMQVWVDGEHLDAHAGERAATSDAAAAAAAATQETRPAHVLQPNAVHAVGRARARHDAAKKAAAALLGRATAEKSLPPLSPPPPRVPAARPDGVAGARGPGCGPVHCPGCVARDAEVGNLKDEVAGLRAEVLGLRMLVRGRGRRGG